MLGGKAPEITEKVVAPAPPEVWIACAEGSAGDPEFEAPCGNEVVVRTSGAMTFNVTGKAVLLAGELLSVIVMMSGKFPMLSVLPEKRPLALLNTMPAGKVPPCSDQVRLPTPPCS